MQQPHELRKKGVVLDGLHFKREITIGVAWFPPFPLLCHAVLLMT